MKERIFIRSVLIAAVCSGICFFCTDPVKPDFGQAPVIGNDKKITMSGIPEKDSILYLILTAEGTEPLVFQWYKNDTLISRATADSLKFEPLKLSDAGTYHCIVSNKQGKDTSKTATISITPRFIVTYDGNNATGGAVPADSNEYKAGATVTVLGNTGNLVKTGSAFAGWNTKADGSGANYSGGDTFTIGTANVTLYAKWTTNPTYTVTYNGNGNTGGSVPVDSNKYESGTTVTVKGNTGSLTKAGCTFANWNTAADGSGVSYTPGATFAMDSANMTLYADWTVNTYIVRFNSNGGSPVDSQIVEYNKTVTEPTPPTRTGYIFAGWHSDQALTVPFIFTTPITSNITLYAKWTPVYTVTYNGNGHTSGTVPVDANNYESGVTVTVKTNSGSLAKTGSTFAGWNTKADGTGANYSGGDTFTMGSADVTLYAKWTTNPTYTVTYNGNGHTSGTVPVDANNYESGVTVIVLGNTGSLAKTGHTFAGWNTAANGSGTSYAAGATFSMGSANVILYAQWTINTYIVKFNSNGGSYVDSQKVAYNTTATEPAPPTMNGYIFAGWYSDQGLTTAFVFTTPITANIILYAKWTPVYMVTYNGNTNTGGTVPVDNNKYINGAVVTVLDNTGTLVKTGHTFSKWNTNAAGTGTDRTPGSTFDMGSANVTLYAKWTGNQYTVTFNANGGTTPNPNTKVVTFASTYGALATTSRTSYTFDGWWTGTGGAGTEITSSSIVSIANDDTLNAKWVIKDADGNIYTEVTIGTQTWMVENLKTTKYNDGTDIPLVQDSASWANLNSPGYCWHNNNIANKDKYGALYNWFTINPTNPKRIAPSGWRVPSDVDWTTLVNYLIANGYNWDGSTTENRIAKAMAAKTNWNSSINVGTPGNDPLANNKSGLSILPSGCRNINGNFYDEGDNGLLWSSSEYDSLNAYYRSLYYDNQFLAWSNLYKCFGFSVRLIKE